MSLHFHWSLINAAGLSGGANGRTEMPRVYRDFRFRDEHHRFSYPLVIVPGSAGTREDAIVPRYFYTYADLEICRRSRFAMQSRRGKLVAGEFASSRI